MVNILFVYPNTISEGYIPGGIAILSAVLKQAGHNTYLFDTTFFETEEKVRDLREKNLEFKSVNFEKEGFKTKKVNIQEEFKKTIEKVKPDLIGATCTSNDYPFLSQLLKSIRKEYKIPIIVGGSHATVSPQSTIEEDFIDMICIGEGEEAMLELANRMQIKESLTDIKNIWIKKEGQIYKNSVRPLIKNLDSLPYPDWDLFDTRHHYKPFSGKIYYFGWFEFGRGCPYSCSYCINPYLHKLYKDKGRIYRTKTTKRMIDELGFFKNKYKIEFIRFMDETFLAMPINKIKNFAKIYTQSINLPFIIATRPESITSEKAKILGKMHSCKHVSIGIESGNEKIRKDICNRNTQQEDIILAFKLIKNAGIGTTSYNMLGLPTENRKNIFETIELNRKAKVDIAVVNFFYPFEGTPLREFCLKKGYISNNSNTMVNFVSDTILNMPQISKKELKGLRKTFSLYLEFPKLLYPLIRLCEYNNILSNALFDIFSKYYHYKYESKK